MGITHVTVLEQEEVSAIRASSLGGAGGADAAEAQVLVDAGDLIALSGQQQRLDPGLPGAAGE